MRLSKNLGNVIDGDEPTGDEYREHLVLEVAGEGIRVYGCKWCELPRSIECSGGKRRT